MVPELSEILQTHTLPWPRGVCPRQPEPSVIRVRGRTVCVANGLGVTHANADQMHSHGRSTWGGRRDGQPSARETCEAGRRYTCGQTAANKRRRVKDAQH
eukprot:469154-Amphidinium_carterae.3